MLRVLGVAEHASCCFQCCLWILYHFFSFLCFKDVMCRELQLCSGFTACHSHSWQSQSFSCQSESNYTTDFLLQCRKFIAKQGAVYAYSYCSNAGNNNTDFTPSNCYLWQRRPNFWSTIYCTGEYLLVKIVMSWNCLLEIKLPNC